MYRLRELDRNDIPTINRWRNKTGLISCLGAPFRFINQEVDYLWFDNYMKSRAKAVRCAIIGEGNAIIGLVSLVNIDHLNQSAEFHIMIGDENTQNKGAGSFATIKMLEHAFNNLNLRRIELSVLDSNKRAIHMYEKIGFVHEGVKRQAKYKNGHFVDLHLYSILKNEFNISSINE